MSEHDLTEEQVDICHRVGVSPAPVQVNQMVGIARNVQSGTLPINGLRHPPADDTTGWYIWAGEHLSSDPDFFVPLHVSHLTEWCPQVIPYLALPAGWRFMIAPGYEDIWQDPSLLDV